MALTAIRLNIILNNNIKTLTTMAKRLLYTTDYRKAGYTLELYREEMEQSGDFSYEELPFEENEDFWEWANRCVNDDFDDLIDNIKYGKFNTECYITGSVGLWYGRREIAKTDCDTLIDAINKCINGQDDFEIYADGHAIYVNSYNHDSQYHGGNEFKIVIRGKKIPKDFPF
jgi:hypothetical protein